jgi:hypothetical protein
MNRPQRYVWNYRAQPRRRITRIVQCATCPRWFDALEGHLVAGNCGSSGKFVCPVCKEFSPQQPKGN